VRSGGEGLQVWRFGAFYFAGSRGCYCASCIFIVRCVCTPIDRRTRIRTQIEARAGNRRHGRREGEESDTRVDGRGRVEVETECQTNDGEEEGDDTGRLTTSEMGETAATTGSTEMGTEGRRGQPSGGKLNLPSPFASSSSSSSSPFLPSPSLATRASEPTETEGAAGKRTFSLASILLVDSGTTPA
jgi:hypothetical protein